MGYTRGKGSKTHKEEVKRKGVTLFLISRGEVCVSFWVFCHCLLSYCPYVSYHPAVICQTELYCHGTGINLCQPTRARWPDGLCGLVQPLCSILPLHTQPHISALSDSVPAFQRWRWIGKCPVCVSVCSVLRAGPALFDHWAAAYPPAGFAASSAKKNSTGFRLGEAISCRLIRLYVCVSVFLSLWGSVWMSLLAGGDTDNDTSMAEVADKAWELNIAAAFA